VQAVLVSCQEPRSAWRDAGPAASDSPQPPTRADEPRPLHQAVFHPVKVKMRPGAAAMAHTRRRTAAGRHRPRAQCGTSCCAVTGASSAALRGGETPPHIFPRTLLVRARPPPAPQPHLLCCCGGGSHRMGLQVILLFPVTPVSKQHKHLQVSCCCCCCAASCRAMMTRRCAEAVSRSLEHGQTGSDRVWFCKQLIQVCACRAPCLVGVRVLGAPFTARGKSD
jgi:hypothetical protein